MRKSLALILLTTACTNVPVNGPSYDSVRERLTDVPTSLYIRDEASTGSITAGRRVGEAWSSGATELAIERGYVRAAIDDSGHLAIQRLEIDVAPIQLGVFEKPAELQDVHLRLATPVQGDVVWTSDDEATASIAMGFEFDWAIKFAGDDPYGLGTQQLPLTRVDVVLGGDGDNVTAQIDIVASGELWNWAGLVEMTDISMSLDARTAY